MRSFLKVLAVSLALAGCSALPSTGPLTEDIVKNADNDLERRYVLVDLDERTAAILAKHPGPSFRARFGDYRPAPDIRVGIGDEVRVTIWEAAAGGLFSAPAIDRFGTGSRSALIPDQPVTRDGFITVPYAGRIDVVGRTPSEIEESIRQRLTGKAIEPQALVTVSRNLSNTVTVTGEVTTGARVPLSIKGDRVLDVIGTAGGVRSAVHESFVRLTRGGATVTVPMETILANPQENVFVRPGDILTVVRSPQTFTAFGAIGSNVQVPFNALGLTLEEGIAKAGGLLDFRSDPDGIFLLRFEPPSIVRELAPERAIDRREQLIPVIYRLSLRDAKNYFLARSFAMRDKDVLYVANATGAELQKFLNLIGSFTSPVLGTAGSVASTVTSVR
ncbi:MAG: polysaccharide export protein [Methylobacteriaceae bacterium]|nr:polysaccharide export protein [Methylobacteriaceae bacterium]